MGTGSSGSSTIEDRFHYLNGRTRWLIWRIIYYLISFNYHENISVIVSLQIIYLILVYKTFDIFFQEYVVSPNKWNCWNHYLIFVLILFIINISHMPEIAEAAQKGKKIAKAQPGRQVRLWVRAKFLSFRRYSLTHLDPKLPKTPTRPFSDLKESTTVHLLNTTLERE